MRGWVKKCFCKFIVFIIIVLSGCTQGTEHTTESDAVNKRVEGQDDTENVQAGKDNQQNDKENLQNDKEDLQKDKEDLQNDKADEFQVISNDDIAFLDEFVIPEYETICKDENSIITKTKGFLGGTDMMWYTIENDGIVYFYYQYLDQDLQPISEVTYLNYAITGEQYTLRCGIHVGMTEEEVYELLPNCVICKPTDSEGALTWNTSSFPEGWCESYDQILMANIEYGEVLPWYLGIMTDKCGVVKAITTCYPTAG